jgi:DNA repair exonuclease SbcCD ATPase subunit
MLEGKGSRNKQRLGSQHEEFLELCALAASGSLSEAEVKKLREHLRACSECREATKEFDAVVDEVIPKLAPELTSEPSLDPSFSQEKAEASFQKRLADEKKRERIGAEKDSSLSAPVVAQSSGFPRHFERYELWLPMAASVLLCVTLGILSYRTGKNHGIEWARLEERSKPAAQAASVDAHAVVQPTTGSHDTELAARDAVLADLRREIAQKSGELERLKSLASSQQLELRTSADDKNGVMVERDRLLRQVSAEEAALRETQERLKNLERERSERVIHTASLESRIAELTNSLNERERLTTEQQDLLAKDRDIRELIGARDLSMVPLLPPGSFVQIDAKQNRIQKGPFKKSSSESHFARPIYFLDIRTGYACGWCQLKDGVLTLVPHPNSGVETRTFRYPSEVSVVGRVTAVTMSIEEERFVPLEEAKKGPTNPKK